MMDLLKLPNVRIGKNGGSIDESNLHLDAKALAWEVATKHPLWTVEVVGMRNFRVLCDTEVLGDIGVEWYGSAMKLFVRNDRIGANNTRKNAYHTDKVDKAYLRVKKTFGPMNLSERMNKAVKVAGDVLENQAYRNRVNAREHERPIDNSLMKWARTNMNQYVSWLTKTNQRELLDNLTRLEALQVDMVTIKETTEAFQNEKTALVVLADGKYIVKIRDNVQLYDDVTLPMELRGKLGMLKLVEKEQMVTGIGCRANDEIFVLVLETMLGDKDEETT